MQLFFDIQHRGELFLDEEGEQFVSVGAACHHLADVLCEFLHSGGEIDAIRDMVIDWTVAKSGSSSPSSISLVLYPALRRDAAPLAGAISS